MFPTTRWSAVIGIASEDEPERRRSWDALLAAYWKPAYKHVRIRYRKSPTDAEDLIQSFFARAVEKEFFNDYDPQRARFRTYFRTCLDRFVINEDSATKTQKRGGGVVMLSYDFGGAEEELALAGSSSPEELFDREWRRHLIALAIDALRVSCLEKNKQACFTVFERYDLAEGDRPTYDQLGRELGLPATTVTNHLAFARRELRRLVLEKLEAITATREELREEAKLLLGVDVG